jgi:hypothetical protein
MSLDKYRPTGSFTGWIGYTLAWTNRTFPELNNGKTFSPRYDRRHDISVVLTYELGESWELGLNWVYGTGQAYTMPTSYFKYKSIGDYDYDVRPEAPAPMMAAF